MGKPGSQTRDLERFSVEPQMATLSMHKIVQVARQIVGFTNNVYPPRQRMSGCRSLWRSGRR